MFYYFYDSTLVVSMSWSKGCTNDFQAEGEWQKNHYFIKLQKIYLVLKKERDKYL